MAIKVELEWIGPPAPAGQYVWVARSPELMLTGGTRESALDNLKREMCEMVGISEVDRQSLAAGYDVLDRLKALTAAVKRGEVLEHHVRSAEAIIAIAEAEGRRGEG